MSAETRKIMEMLAEGKISLDEAERLLEKIHHAPASGEADPAHVGSDPAPRPRPKFLRIVVNGKGDETVNIRVPLGLIRTGLKLSSMLPSHANQRLSEKGIDLTALSSLQGDELIDALRELSIDVDSDSGEKVRIFCE